MIIMFWLLIVLNLLIIIKKNIMEHIIMSASAPVSFNQRLNSNIPDGFKLDKVKFKEGLHTLLVDWIVKSLNSLPKKEFNTLKDL